ncbi:MAG: hypothetical protein LBE35_06120 [Clostridiales bacterium]|jgi:hypothetical protein|nr:hypothetical protein [Clostridiales bacterium]
MWLMVRVFEALPVEKNFVCPGGGGAVAAWPFSACKDCRFMSHMFCSAGAENFVENSKKGLQFN